MKEIYQNLYVGNDNDCVLCDSEFAIVHACKTCHQKGVGYNGNLHCSHPNYLIFENGTHLYLNMVDMDKELLPKYTHPIMKAALNFIEKHIKNRKVLIHCNQGHSRSPAIALVYLAINGIINNKSYEYAASDFIQKYKEYTPIKGISVYLKNNWFDLLSF